MARTTILGLAKLERKLKRLPKVAEDEIRASMQDVAEDIVRLARSLVPKESGDLAKSIGWTWGAPPRGSLTLGKVVRSQLGKGLTITVYAGDDKAFYARWVEFGTAPHNVAKGGGNKSFKGEAVQHPGASKKPFFFPAYRANRKSAKSAIRKATRSAAKKVAAGG
jgi:HK97 gp10 family phage protein